MPQTPGVADHGAPKVTFADTLNRLAGAFSRFMISARKAWIGFLVAGGASAIMQNIVTLNFSTVGLHNLWQGLIGGVLTGFIVYWVRNEMAHYTGPAVDPQSNSPPG